MERTCAPPQPVRMYTIDLRKYECSAKKRKSKKKTKMFEEFSLVFNVLIFFSLTYTNQNRRLVN